MTLRLPPLWLRWVLAIVVAVIASLALVRFVSTHNAYTEAPLTPQAAAREKQEDDALMAEDQAPHAALLPAGGPISTGLARAVRAYLAGDVAAGTIPGPVTQSSCKATGSRAGRVGFSCTVTAASVRYPFLAAVRVATHRAVYCKHDPAPLPAQGVPVSARCRIS